MAFWQARRWCTAVLLAACWLPGVVLGKVVQLSTEPEYFYQIQTGPTGIEFETAQDAFAAYQAWLEQNHTPGHPKLVVSNLRPAHDSGTVNGRPYSWVWDWQRIYPSWPDYYEGGVTGKISMSQRCPTASAFPGLAWNVNPNDRPAEWRGNHWVTYSSCILHLPVPNQRPPRCERVPPSQKALATRWTPARAASLSMRPTTSITTPVI